MILDEVINFLRKEPPFQFLDETTLKSVAGSLYMEFYPRDTAILKQGGKPSESLRIIKKGSVKVFMKSEDGLDVMMDYKGEGDNFGFLSMIGDNVQKTSVIAAEDTICYVLSKDKVLKLLAVSPAFTGYFMSYLSGYVDRTYSEMKGKGLFYSGTDRFLFTTHVGDIAKDVITINDNSTIQDAARLMTRSKVSSIVVLDKMGLPAGIVTDRDMREKVVAEGRSMLAPLTDIMTMSLVRVDAADSCFEAVLKMLKFNIHHVLVIEESKLKGIMTNHDLMLMQGKSPLSFANDIDNQQSIEGLAAVWRKLNNIVGLLIEEGAKASGITKIITEINDRLEKKVLEIAEKKIGTPPVPYCWIVFGSEGRKEQTFKTDQDNAIIYADPSTTEEREKCEEYFQAFTGFVRDSLTKIGVPLCPANFMASNPLWRQPLSVWKKYFATWISEPEPEAVLNALVMFDFRPLYGKFGLAEDLRNYLKTMLDGQGIFFGHMANTILKHTPPVGFFRSFVVEKSGEHKDEFNLKIKGITPLVDAIRFFALEKGIEETSTSERINALKERHAVVKEYSDDLEHAFEFIMFLKIRHQFEQITGGVRPDNFINPDSLSNLEKKTLKEAFHLISKLQGMIFEMYKPFIR